jgi:hypothetical protein
MPSIATNKSRANRREEEIFLHLGELLWIAQPDKLK